MVYLLSLELTEAYNKISQAIEYLVFVTAKPTIIRKSTQNLPLFFKFPSWFWSELHFKTFTFNCVERCLTVSKIFFGSRIGIWIQILRLFAKTTSCTKTNYVIICIKIYINNICYLQVRIQYITRLVSTLIFFLLKFYNRNFKWDYKVIWKSNSRDLVESVTEAGADKMRDRSNLKL